MLTLSIGMAQGSTHHVGADELIKDATAALNKARQSGAGHEAVFDPDMQRRARDRLRIEADLHQALRREELRVFWQPIVELGPNRLAGLRSAAALGASDARADLAARVHPGGGGKRPDRADRQVRAARGAAPGQGLARGGRASDLFVSVNVSSRQLDSPDLVEAVTAALSEHPVPAGCLHIEITESAVMRDVARSQDVLKQLKALGCHMALDDFGTGHSSLSLLQRLPLDYVKIDRSFITAMSGEFAGESMVGAIIQIAKILHLTVIAEGIEAETDELRLRAPGLQVRPGLPLWQAAAGAAMAGRPVRQPPARASRNSASFLSFLMSSRFPSALAPRLGGRPRIARTRFRSSTSVPLPVQRRIAALRLGLRSQLPAGFDQRAVLQHVGVGDRQRFQALAPAATGRGRTHALRFPRSGCDRGQQPE
jgi:predicted signal transduction protein with EAL and GGDEF domain